MYRDVEVQGAIKRFIAESNGNQKLFASTANTDRIIQAAPPNAGTKR